MGTEDLLEAIRKRPFEPFRVCLTDGMVYEVRHPEMVLPGRRTVIIGIPGNVAQPVFDRTVTVALIHIVRLEPLDSPVGQGGQGS